MKITVTALFDAADSARLAASTLAMAQGGSLGLTVVTRAPGQGIAFGRSAFAALGGRQEHGFSNGECMVTVSCGADQEAFVMGELASLGARKISQTCREE